jgi:hypothetical protein
MKGKTAHLNQPKSKGTTTSSEPESPTTELRRQGVKPSKPRGRKPGPPATELRRRGRKPSAPKRRTPPGRGGLLLRNSINSLVGQESDRIAQALIDKTVAGNMVGARLLVELSGADKVPLPAKKKRRGPSLADLLAKEPEWTEADEARLNHDASRLAPSEPDWDDPQSVAAFEALNARNSPTAS